MARVEHNLIFWRPRTYDTKLRVTKTYRGSYLLCGYTTDVKTDVRPITQRPVLVRLANQLYYWNGLGWSGVELPR